MSVVRRRDWQRRNASRASNWPLNMSFERKRLKTKKRVRPASVAEIDDDQCAVPFDDYRSQ
jgi:hypothetical protein